MCKRCQTHYCQGIAPVLASFHVPELQRHFTLELHQCSNWASFTIRQDIRTLYTRSYTSVGLIHYIRPIHITQELHQCWPHLLHQSYKLCIGVTPVLPNVLRLDFQLGTLLLEARGGVWDGGVLSADSCLNPCPVELQWKAGEIMKTTHSKMMHLIVAWWRLSPRIQKNP